MTIPILKISVLRKPVIKGKMDVRFPARVSAQSPVLIDRTGGNFEFSLDINALVETLEAIFAPVSIINEPTVVTASSAAIAVGTTSVAVNRVAPSATALSLPPVVSQGGLPIKIFDWSTSVTDHTITLTPSGSEKIMRQATWPMYSNSASLAGLTLHPSITLGGWYIAP